jgi:hypothetical protein
MNIYIFKYLDVSPEMQAQTVEGQHVFQVATHPTLNHLGFIEERQDLAGSHSEMNRAKSCARMDMTSCK